jgi:AcrR family transcriptional regulator
MESGRTWRLQVAAPTDGAIIAEVTGVQRVAQTRPAATAAAATAPVGDGRWQRIFEAACEVIGRRGYGDASMREIARVAGLPIATMYQTIGAKEDLLFMITEGCMRQLFDTFQQGLGGDGTAEGRVREAISAYVDYIDRNRKYINLVYRETRSLSPANRERIFAIERDFAAKWRALLDTGVAEGALRCADTEFAAHALYFLCTIWALRHWALDGFDAAQVKTCLGDLVLDGLKPRTARDRRETA